MKKIVIIFMVLVLSLLIVGCDNNEKLSSEVTKATTQVSTTKKKDNPYPYLSVIDYKTKKEVVRFTQSDYEKANIVASPLNAKTKVQGGIIHHNPNYTVVLAQTEEKSSEVWFDIFIDDGKVYCRRLPVKGTANEGIKDAGVIYESELVTAKQFLEAIGKK